ncbi:MAG: 50S ribosomal protein L4 [Chlamydiae bacterium]|nr:50S ribosomal protein L4 [Chlamydiota bacterium]
MAKLKKYDLSGKPQGDVDVDDSLLKSSGNTQMIKDYLVAIRANARQWSACTQTRAEVNHSKKKPHPQKGTGNARQGFLGSPQYKGGGRVFAPRPKFDQHVRINKRERRSAIRTLLSEKITNDRAFVLQAADLDKPQTKTLVKFIKSLRLKGSRVLVLYDAAGSAEMQAFYSKSMRNIPKVEFGMFRDVNGYDLAVSHDVIFFEGAIDELKVTLEEGK